MSSAKVRKHKKRKHVETIPEHAPFENPIRSFGDETPSDDTADQEENSKPVSSQDNGSEQTEDKPYEKKARKRTARAWQYLEEFEEGGKKFAKCKICQVYLKMTKTSPTTILNRHVDRCKALHGLARQTQLQIQVSENSSEMTIPSFKYEHTEMRKTIAHYILIEELPFLHVESFMFNEVMRKVMRKATPHWQKISRATVKADCKTTYEIEKKKLKELFKSVKRINITTDMWTSSNQKLGYMVVTGHWIDQDWKLNMRVLNFFNVPPPYSGYVIAESIFKCLNEWGIENKIGTITVDNAKANDVALRNLKEMFSIRKNLPVEGKFFHMRCCAHILNLCVQDGLKAIESIVDRIRDGIKYVAGSEGRRSKFAEISSNLQIKPKKLILDVPTRWNSTFNMLQCAIQFKKVFPRFATYDGGFMDYVPNLDDWEKVEGVCSVLEVFNDVTMIVSGSQYPTSNLFISEIKRVKQILDKKVMDQNFYIREMARSMKEKFDKYWGDSNLVMSVGAVMDPRFKMKLPIFCFPTLYPMEGESDRNLANLTSVLNELYQDYFAEDRAKRIDSQESSQASFSDNNAGMNQRETPQGINDYESFIRESGAILEPMKSELDDYLAEKIMIPTSKSFDALAWWKINTAKYPILSTLARDILSIPISTVASESTFSAGGRVIEPHRSCLKPETVEMLMCGADWARECYGLKKSNQKNMFKDVEIYLS